MAVRKGVRPLFDPAELCGRQAESELHRAARTLMFADIETAIERGCNPASRNKFNETPLMVMLSQRREKIAENVHTVLYFISKFAQDVNLSDSKARTALHYACLINITTIIDRLIQVGADVNAQDAWSRTSLHVTLRHAGSHKLRIVTRLLKAGCNVNAVDNVHETALYLAVRQGDAHMELIRQLLAYGADPHIPDKVGVNSIMLAVYTVQPQTLRLLLSDNYCPFGKAFPKRSCIVTFLLFHPVYSDKACLQCFRLLVNSGFLPLQSQIWSKECIKLTSSLSGSSEKLQLIESLRSNPLTLKQLARIRIRRSLFKNIKEKLKQLGGAGSDIDLPPSFQSYLQLKDVT